MTYPTSKKYNLHRLARLIRNVTHYENSVSLVQMRSFDSETQKNILEMEREIEKLIFDTFENIGRHIFESLDGAQSEPTNETINFIRSTSSTNISTVMWTEILDSLSKK